MITHAVIIPVLDVETAKTIKNKVHGLGYGSFIEWRDEQVRKDSDKRMIE